MDNIFLTKKKKKKKIAAARLASFLATRWTGNKLFFMDSPANPRTFDAEHILKPYLFGLDAEFVL